MGAKRSVLRFRRDLWLAYRLWRKGLYFEAIDALKPLDAEEGAR